MVTIDHNSSVLQMQSINQSDERKEERISSLVGSRSRLTFIAFGADLSAGSVIFHGRFSCRQPFSVRLDGKSIKFSTVHVGLREWPTRFVPTDKRR